MASQAVGTGATPNVRVTGRRVVAIIIDSILLGILGGIMSALFGTSTAVDGGASFSLTGLPAVIYFLLILLYFALMEGYLGQTLGKMILGIKVVREGAIGAPGLGAGIIRTLLRIIDGLFFYLVGFIIVLISSKNQRLGDMAANTLVVRT